MGGPDKIERQHAGGKLTVRERHRRAARPRARSTRSAPWPARRRYGEDGAARVEFTPEQLRHGSRPHRRPTGRGGRRRLHRARRRGRRRRSGRSRSTPSRWRTSCACRSCAWSTAPAAAARSSRSTPTDAPTCRRCPAGSTPSTTWPPCRWWRWPSGSVAGLGAARVVNSHYSLMVRDTSQVFVAGPPVVARVEAAVTKEELGGDQIHGRNGVVDDVVDSEAEAFERTRRFLSYLPSSVHERGAPDERRPTIPSARDEWLLGGHPPVARGRSTRSGPIIETLVDAGSWFEIGAGWGRAAVCGLARLDGWPVGGAVVGPLPGRRQLDGRRQRQGHALRRPGRHLPPAGGAPRRPARLHGRRGGRAGRHHPPRRAGRGRHPPGRGAVVLGADPQGVRRGRRRPPELVAPVVPLRLAVGLVGIAAGRGRGRGRLPGRARRARRRRGPRRPASPRSPPAWTRCRSPFRTAEAFLVEEIIDPRDTRPLLCEFANLAAPLRQPGVPPGPTVPERSIDDPGSRP